MLAGDAGPCLKLASWTRAPGAAALSLSPRGDGRRPAAEIERQPRARPPRLVQSPRSRRRDPRVAHVGAAEAEIADERIRNVEMFDGSVRGKSGDSPIQERGHADHAARLHLEAVQKLKSRQSRNDPPRSERIRRWLQLAGARDVERPEAAGQGVSDIDDRLVRREADAVRR